MIHSEEDWRCPVEQGARLFVALKRRGVPTELLLFPGEGHELSRSGRPQHRLRALRARPPLVGALAADPGEPAAVAGWPRRPRGGRVSRRGRATGARAGRSSRELVRPRRLPGDATDRRLARAADRPPTSARSPAVGPRGRSSTTPTAPPTGSSRCGARARRSRGWSSRPSVLRDVSTVDLGHEILGTPSALPFAFAPTGFTRMMHPEGERGGGRGRRAGRHPVRALDHGHDVDRGARRGRAGRAQVVPALPLARPRQRQDLVQRAAAAGYDTLMLTVDTPVAGARQRDVRNGLSIPPALTAADVPRRRDAPALVVRHAHHRAADVRQPGLVGAARWRT